MFYIHLVIEGHRFSLVPTNFERGPYPNYLKSSYEFDRNLLVVEQICAFENDAK